MPLTFTRRNLIKTAALAAAASATPSFALGEGFFARNHLEIGAQLYPLSAEVAKDIDGTFARLAALGVRAVETSGFHGYTPTRLRAAADRAGLTVRSVHVQPQFHMDPHNRLLTEDLGPLIDTAHVLGARHIVMPLVLLPEADVPPMNADAFNAFMRAARKFGEADWQHNAEFLNRTGERLGQAGLRLAYHNHNYEFAPVAGTTGYDILMRGTDPALVDFEMDLGWVAAAGRDPLVELKAHPGRVRMLHIKGISPATVPNFEGKQMSALLGQDRVNWDIFLHAALAAGVTGYFLEQEPPFANGPFAPLGENVAYLKALR